MLIDLRENIKDSKISNNYLCPTAALSYKNVINLKWGGVLFYAASINLFMLVLECGDCLHET